MTVRETGRWLRSREISCVELVRQTLERIEAGDVYNSFITKTPELALAEAAERDKELSDGHDSGPLHGIPIAHKDLFYTKGIRTTAGSPVFRDFIPEYDADAVTRLREAGAVSLGKTNLHELAYGITSKNPHYGFVLNPRDTNRVAGGSSGGSASLIAAGLLPFATGTDTGGSIRVPAAFCGITGIMPTFDLVSRRGVLPLSFSLDHVGPLGSCVEDCALALNALAGGEFNLPVLPNLRAIRVGVPKNFYFDRIDDEVATCVNRAISSMQKLGAAVEEVTVPDPPKTNSAARIVQLSETAALYADNTDPNEFSPETWELLQQGRFIKAHDYVNALRMRSVFRREWDEVWTGIDVLALPTTPTVAPRLEQKRLMIAGREEDVRLATTRLVRAFNYTGDPALSMPCGTNSLGLPVGLQLVATPYSDARLLQIAKTLEADLGLKL